jgi:hypothetical protein
MKIQIDYSPVNNNYVWKIWDGPEHIDYAEGSESSLGSCFEKIIEFRFMNGLSYSDPDPSTAADLISNYFEGIRQK